MAARDTGVGAVETLLHQGKLLALDLLVKVFENPLHVWQNVRPEVCTSVLGSAASAALETLHDCMMRRVQINAYNPLVRCIALVNNDRRGLGDWRVH